MGSSSTSPSSCASFPSAESPVPPRYKYDVFLSFRGEDTRKGIIFNLYYELQGTGRIKTFKDDEGLEIGMPISPNLLRAIEESRFVIVVLSPNYASSTWCLEELVNIFRCMEGKDRILPLFYYVNPSDVRKQRGSFGVALSQLEENCSQDPERVKQWRIALGKVGSLSGWDIRNFSSERDLVKHIVGFVCSKVPKVPRPVDSTASAVHQLMESKRHVMDESLEEFEEEHFSVGPYGSNKGGESFDDGSYSTVRQLVLCYDKYRIYYIQIQYDCDGIPMWSDKHGDFDNDEITTTVTLDYPDEFLTAMNGYHERLQLLPTQISSLTFKSNKKIYGPFGSRLAGINFSIRVPKSKIVGFHGRSSNSSGLRAIGAHLKSLDC
ncbi:PREDICTED: protein SUPPRESSOR OF npr1-1, CONSTITUTIVE 1-like [Fragaria vesca subsp. vesca]